MQCSLPASTAFTQWSFRPAGATCCPDKREIWHGGVDHRTAACQISCLLGQKCGNTAPKMVTIWNFAHECAPQGRLICTVFMKFSEFVCVCRQLLTFHFGRFWGTNNHVISIFHRWGHFPTNFQQPLVAKLLIGSKKSWGCKNGTYLLYYGTVPSMVGIAGCAPAVDKKV